MLVRMLTGLSGPAYTIGPGDEREFPDGEAMRLIEAGYAVPISERPMERAVVAPVPETRRRGRPRKND